MIHGPYSIELFLLSSQVLSRQQSTGFFLLFVEYNLATCRISYLEKWKNKETLFKKISSLPFFSIKSYKVVFDEYRNALYGGGGIFCSFIFCFRLIYQKSISLARLSHFADEYIVTRGCTNVLINIGFCFHLPVARRQKCGQSHTDGVFCKCRCYLTLSARCMWTDTHLCR